MMKLIVFGVVGLWLLYALKGGNESEWGTLATVLLVVMYVGAAFIVFVLPWISDGFIRFLYSDPGGKVEENDPMRESRALQAQGDYLGAVESLRDVVEDDPRNRLAWSEIVKIQQTQLEDAEGALSTLKKAEAVEGLGDEDRVYFLFRMVELQRYDFENEEEAVALLQQVRVQFPETRHAANAMHQLREMGVNT